MYYTVLLLVPFSVNLALKKESQMNKLTALHSSSSIELVNVSIASFYKLTGNHSTNNWKLQTKL